MNLAALIRILEGGIPAEAKLLRITRTSRRRGCIGRIARRPIAAALAEGDDYRDWIKSTAEPHKRVVKENQLQRQSISWPHGKSALMLSFTKDHRQRTNRSEILCEDHVGPCVIPFLCQW